MILFYLKVYPTYDFASILWIVDKSQICRWVKSLLPVLEIGLGRSNSLPRVDKGYAGLQNLVDPNGFVDIPTKYKKKVRLTKEECIEKSVD